MIKIDTLAASLKAAGVRMSGVRRVRRWVAGGLVMTSALAVVLPARTAQAAIAPSLVHPSTTTSENRGPGYSFMSAHVVGVYPKGMTVYVVRTGATGAQRKMINGAQRAIAQMRTLGLPVRYGGVVTTAPTRAGTITVKRSARGCLGGAVGSTENRSRSIPGHLNAFVVTSAAVSLCPALFGSSRPEIIDTVLHELGHAVGLGHITYRVNGRLQVMYPVNNVGRTSYQSGDRAGLARLAAGTRAAARYYR